VNFFDILADMLKKNGPPLDLLVCVYKDKIIEPTGYEQPLLDVCFFPSHSLRTYSPIITLLKPPLLSPPLSSLLPLPPHHPSTNVVVKYCFDSWASLMVMKLLCTRFIFASMRKVRGL
jgi:hypothetical protein